jgi:hypothetical protein
VDALTALFLAFSALAIGFAGGYGGRRLAHWQLTSRIGGLEEALEGFDRRLRKREGAAGAERRELVKDAQDAAQVEIAKIVAGWPQLRPPASADVPAPVAKDRGEILRLARMKSGQEPQGA